jgi:type IV secretion system protein VirD4
MAGRNWWEKRDWPRISGTLGEAGYAYLEELERHKLLLGDDAPRWARCVWLGYAINTEWNQGGQTVAFPNGSQYALGFSGETNILTIGSAGSGKNACAIMPTLMLNQESVFVNDIKGENWWVTHAWREQGFHQRIICINPFNLFGEELGFDDTMTNYYNPLAGLSDGSHGKFAQRINGLAAALIVPEGKEPHWTNRARDVVSCLMAIVATSADEIGDGTNHLPRVMDLLSFSPEKLAEYVDAALHWCDLPMVVNNAQSIIAGGNEFSGVISTAKGQLSFLNDPKLRAFLSKSDFDFSDLRKERCTVYLMIPPAEMLTYFRFARVLVQACLDTLSASSLNERDSVLVVLDEQAKLRGMEIIETSAATLRGYNVRIWSAYQDINQIQRDYERSWETFIANAGVVQVLTVNDATTAEYFSKKAGEYGVPVESTTGTYAPNAKYSTPFSTTTGQQRVRFIKPEDFYGMSASRALSFVQGLGFPVLSAREGYYDLDTFKGRRMASPDHPPKGWTAEQCWQAMRDATAAARERQRAARAAAMSPQEKVRAVFYRGKQ